MGTEHDHYPTVVWVNIGTEDSPEWAYIGSIER